MLFYFIITVMLKCQYRPSLLPLSLLDNFFSYTYTVHSLYSILHASPLMQHFLTYFSTWLNTVQFGRTNLLYIFNRSHWQSVIMLLFLINDHLMLILSSAYPFSVYYILQYYTPYYILHTTYLVRVIPQY